MDNFSRLWSKTEDQSNSQVVTVLIQLFWIYLCVSVCGCSHEFAVFEHVGICIHVCCIPEVGGLVTSSDKECPSGVSWSPWPKYPNLLLIYPLTFIHSHLLSLLFSLLRSVIHLSPGPEQDSGNQINIDPTAPIKKGNQITGDIKMNGPQWNAEEGSSLGWEPAWLHLPAWLRLLQWQPYQARSSFTV